jgi:hypothetical protein
MKHTAAVAALLALFATGCVGEVTTSSRSVLDARASRAAVALAPVAVAHEVTRLLGARDYDVVSEQPAPGGGITLKLAKPGQDLQEQPGLFLGSVIYVWVTPSGTGSVVDLVGKPTLDGNEPCSAATPQLACTGVSATARFRDTYLSGRREATVVQGVLEELARNG